jgi:hypothetical protein
MWENMGLKQSVPFVGFKLKKYQILSASHISYSEA